MSQNCVITRKKFISLTGLALLGASAGGIQFLNRGKVRIRPLLGRKYSESFLKLCERGRFRTAHEAIKSVRDQVTEFEIVLEEKNSPRAHRDKIS
ncbi:MAG: hypothetical protein K1X66_01670 [Verrucomicrobiae bacterium]|nr:hypothetical protein [Verrucomicrobiae bacterium]